MRLTIVYTDHVFNQGYHVSFNGLLRQVSIIMPTTTRLIMSGYWKGVSCLLCFVIMIINYKCLTHAHCHNDKLTDDNHLALPPLRFVLRANCNLFV